MSTYKIIKKILQSSSIKVVVKKLEYRSEQKAFKIVDSFLASKDLYSWLHSGYYDFKYTPKEFLKKLCLVFKLDYKTIENELKKEEVYYRKVTKVQKNYIFVNTNFRRKNEPIFALACLEYTRKIGLEVKTVVFKNKDEVLKIVSKIVQKHYKETNGRLNIWGVIVNYVYYHDDEIFTFDKEGKIIKNSHIVHTKATLKIKGKTLC